MKTLGSRESQVEVHSSSRLQKTVHRRRKQVLMHMEGKVRSYRKMYMADFADVV